MTEALAQAGLPLEILGYTTRAWKGGLSREHRLGANKPLNPGRLNDLRHLIYKSFAQSQTDAAANLYLMCREGLLKENIDGEALIWAHQRAQAHRAKIHLLIVITDGAPVDDSTLSVNPGNYLERHLRSVIENIECNDNTKLLGIGLQYDVSRYFKGSRTVDDLKDLGSAIFDLVIGVAAPTERVASLSGSPAIS